MPGGDAHDGVSYIYDIHRVCSSVMSSEERWLPGLLPVFCNSDEDGPTLSVLLLLTIYREESNINKSKIWSNVSKWSHFTATIIKPIKEKKNVAVR